MMRTVAYRLSRGLWWLMETTDTRANHLFYPLYNRLAVYAAGPWPPEGSR